MHDTQTSRWPTAEEFAERLYALGWRAHLDAQHSHITQFWNDFTRANARLNGGGREFIEAVAAGFTSCHHQTQELHCSHCDASLDRAEPHKADCLMLRAQALLAGGAVAELSEAAREANRHLLAAHDSKHPQPFHCHKCGLPKSVNPHPDAGVPGVYLEVGCPTECIPCLVANRHGWYQRAAAAEAKLRLLGIDPATPLDTLRDALEPEDSTTPESPVDEDCQQRQVTRSALMAKTAGLFNVKPAAQADASGHPPLEYKPSGYPQSCRLNQEHHFSMMFPSSLTHGNPGFEEAAYRGYTLQPLWDEPSDYDKDSWTWGFVARGRYGDILWPDGSAFAPEKHLPADDTVTTAMGVAGDAILDKLDHCDCGNPSRVQVEDIYRAMHAARPDAR